MGKFTLIAFAAVLVAAFLLFGGVSFLGLDRPEQPPVIQSPEPEAPAGTVAWTDMEFEFTHFPPIPPQNGGDNKAHWTFSKQTMTLQPPEAYHQHEIKVWESTLDEGFSWNLQGHYEVVFSYQLFTTKCGTPYILDTCSADQQIGGWDSGKIVFEGNQGASGKLFIRPPTLFFMANGNYRLEVSSTLIFKDSNSAYTETDVVDHAGTNFNVP